MNEVRDRNFPLAARLTGRTQAGAAEFADPDADFDAAGVKPGDTLFVLSGQSRGVREVSGGGPRVLTTKGPPFAIAETGLAYFVRRADGRIWPDINLARELDPAYPGWTGPYVPVANAHGIAYYRCSSANTSNGRLVDPWSKPYIYIIQVGSSKIVEKIVCSGPDRKMGTADDLEEVIAELPFGGK